MMRHRAERIINSSCVKRSVIIGSVETPFPFFQEFLRKFSVSSSSELLMFNFLTHTFFLGLLMEMIKLFRIDYSEQIRME